MFYVCVCVCDFENRCSRFIILRNGGVGRKGNKYCVVREKDRKLNWE